ncbi:hypothetical protein PU560_01715, partial [Georgenia sp. 10Sc9-8]|nr:hypothetical protein [Georgenia halotolerans]
PPARETLERVRSELAEMRLLCTVSDQGEQLTAHYTSAAPLPDLAGARLAVRTISDATWTGVDGEYLDHTARTTIAGLTGFLAVRLTLDGEQVEMAVSCEMHGAPEDRQDRLLAHLIASPARLVRYLLMLLTDEPEDRFDGATQALMTAAARAGNDLGTVPLLEVMLRTAVRNPERLGAVERLMDVVRRSDELRDDDLLTLWDNVRALTTAGTR